MTRVAEISLFGDEYFAEPYLGCTYAQSSRSHPKKKQTSFGGQGAVAKVLVRRFRLAHIKRTHLFQGQEAVTEIPSRALLELDVLLLDAGQCARDGRLLLRPRVLR